jgi:nicotinate-nucleotide adenylyltransferase
MIGILGGTFDPVHLGHLAAAEQVRGAARLDEVWLMPNARPPHKVDGPHASAQDRLAMVELAVKSRPGLRASDLEVRRGGLSYTVDTLAGLASLFPQATFALLLGYDAALQIRTWHRVDDLLRAAHFAIFERPSVDLKESDVYALGFPPERTQFLRIHTPPIAAHEIRARLQSGQSVEGLLPPPVADYIHEHELYGTRRKPLGV